jgi:STE24 endopeptidase
MTAALLISIPSLPVSWRWQFKTEAEFGFNRTTPKLWIIDRLKGLLLAVAIGWPFATLIIKLATSMGPGWWIWAWAIVLLFQLTMMVLAFLYSTS